jgi:predicted nucleotidyltransferase
VATPLPHDVDAALGELTARIAEILGPSLVGIFLEGSFAWGNPVETSDLDLRIIVHLMPSEPLRAELDGAQAEAQSALGIEVGLNLDTLDNLMRVGALRFQRSRWLAGEDIRATVPMKAVGAFVRDSIITAHDLIVGLREHHSAPLGLPLTAPLPEGEFRGYDIREILDEGDWVRSSKRLVTNVTAIATALIARRANVYVFTKGEVPALYAQHVGDEWAALVSTVYDDCRVRSGYRLPEEPADRAALTVLCDRAVAFENRLMDISIPMLRELAATGTEKQKESAARRLTAIGQPPVT